MCSPNLVVCFSVEIFLRVRESTEVAGTPLLAGSATSAPSSAASSPLGGGHGLCDVDDINLVSEDIIVDAGKRKSMMVEVEI